MSTYLRPVSVAINGKPKMFFLPLLLNRYVLSLVASLAFAAGSYFAWQHYVAGPYRAQGRAEMLPTLASATTQLDHDTAAFGEIAKALGSIKENSERLKKQALRAQQVKIVRQEVEKTRIEYIDRIVPAGDTECERTSDAIKKVLR